MNGWIYMYYNREPKDYKYSKYHIHKDTPMMSWSKDWPVSWLNIKPTEVEI